MSLALIAVAAVVAAHSLGCATAEQRHRMLVLFFDGVPPLAPQVPVPPSDEPAEAVRAGGRPRPEPVAIVSVHGPVAAKECEQCHSGSRSKRLLEPKQDLCWSCHDRKDFPGEFVHGPVAAGYCDACHNPHRSPNAHLLVRKETELCVGCHDTGSDPKLLEHRTENGDDCQRCHDPHAADREYMLKRDAEPS